MQGNQDATDQALMVMIASVIEHLDRKGVLDIQEMSSFFRTLGDPENQTLGQMSRYLAKILDFLSKERAEALQYLRAMQALHATADGNTGGSSPPAGDDA